MGRFSKFGQIWAKISPYLRKFWKKSVILFKIWPKIGPIGIWMGCMGLLSNSVAAHPYQNQTWVPPGVLPLYVGFKKQKQNTKQLIHTHKLADSI